MSVPYRTATPSRSRSSRATSWAATAAALPRRMPAGDETREAQGVARPVGGLDAERPLRREQGGEQDGEPEQPGRGAVEDDPVGVEREAEQEQDEQRERRHLVRRDAAPQPRCGGPCPRRAPRHEARAASPESPCRVGESVTTPPATVTVLVATLVARSRSWLATRTVAPARGGVGDQAVEDVPSGLVEPGVGLVEQPQLRAAGDEAGDRRAAALPGRQPADGDAGEPAVEVEVGHRRSPSSEASTRGPRPEAKVVGDGEVVVEAGEVAEQPDPAAHGAAAGRRAQVEAEHLRFALGDRKDAGAGPQDRRLARHRSAPQQHDLALLDGEIGPGERREPAEQRHCGAEGDDGAHGTAVKGSEGGARGAGRDLTYLDAVAKHEGGTRKPQRGLVVAKVLSGVGRTMITVGDAPAPVRRLPAVGHGHPHRPGAEPARRRARRTARRRRRGQGRGRRATTHDADDGRGPDGHHDHAPRRRRAPSTRCRRRSDPSPALPSARS